MVKIVCEGKTDKKKIKEILEFLQIKYTDDNFIVAGNKPNLLNKDLVEYKILKQQIDNEIVQKILFLVDVDFEKNDKTYGYKNTEIRINKLRNDLEVEEISDYYLLCDPEIKEGYLESLLLSTISNEVKECFEQLIECKELNAKYTHKNILEEFYRISRPNSPYNFTHPNFKDLKQKLTNLFN
jgi:hypothetical protein